MASPAPTPRTQLVRDTVAGAVARVTEDKGPGSPNPPVPDEAHAAAAVIQRSWRGQQRGQQAREDRRARWRRENEAARTIQTAHRACAARRAAAADQRRQVQREREAAAAAIQRAYRSSMARQRRREEAGGEAGTAARTHDGAMAEQQPSFALVPGRTEAVVSIARRHDDRVVAQDPHVSDRPAWGTPQVPRSPLRTPSARPVSKAAAVRAESASLQRMRNAAAVARDAATRLRTEREAMEERRRRGTRGYRVHSPPLRSPPRPHSTASRTRGSPASRKAQLPDLPLVPALVQRRVEPTGAGPERPLVQKLYNLDAALREASERAGQSGETAAFGLDAPGSESDDERDRAAIVAADPAALSAVERAERLACLAGDDIAADRLQSAQRQLRMAGDELSSARTQASDGGAQCNAVEKQLRRLLVLASRKAGAPAEALQHLDALFALEQQDAASPLRGVAGPTGDRTLASNLRALNGVSCGSLVNGCALLAQTGNVNEALRCGRTAARVLHRPVDRAAAALQSADAPPPVLVERTTRRALRLLQLGAKALHNIAMAQVAAASPEERDAAPGTYGSALSVATAFLGPDAPLVMSLRQSAAHFAAHSDTTSYLCNTW